MSYELIMSIVCLRALTEDELSDRKREKKRKGWMDKMDENGKKEQILMAWLIKDGNVNVEILIISTDFPHLISLYNTKALEAARLKKELAFHVGCVGSRMERSFQVFSSFQRKFSSVQSFADFLIWILCLVFPKL